MGNPIVQLLAIVQTISIANGSANRPISKKGAGRIGDGFRAVVILHPVVPADLGDEQAVAFHAGHSFFREAAGFRIGAGFADPAAAGAQAQGIRVLFPNFLRELSEGSGVLPFDAGVALVVNCLFQFSHGLQQDAPPARGQGGRKRPFRWSESGSGLFDAAPR